MNINELVLIDGLYYKKFTESSFTGQTSGQIQGSFKNGALDGLYIEYYDNGRVKKKGSYKNNNEDGNWFYYDVNGKLEKECMFQDGSLIYKDTEKDEFGTYTGGFKDGKKFGKGTFTLNDGSKYTCEYKNDYEYTFTYDDGTQYVSEFKNELDKFLIDNQTTLLQRFYRISYWENGKLKDKVEYKNDKKNGSYESFYENGKKEYLGEYKNGKKHGLWSRHSANRYFIYSKGEYKNGKKTGYWTFCNLDGRINEQFSGFYKDDKRSNIN